MRRRAFGAALLLAMALGTLALLIPPPKAYACLFCTPIYGCPPCYKLVSGSCFRCPSCAPIPGCKT
ncbi:MAG: hypothetical protein LAO51_03645 [Acidobacteriia bacterium]|nr:hypothetical protein [Terriglobia bacterium]